MNGMIHGIMITDGTNEHPAEYHAEMTASKLIATAESATEDKVSAARDLRKRVEAILLDFHGEVGEDERRRLKSDPARRKAERVSSADHDCRTVIDQIVEAARGTALEYHFSRPEVRAAMEVELRHETRSQMNVCRCVHDQIEKDESKPKFLGGARTTDATTAITNDCKRSLLEGGHNFKSSGGIAYKMLLIKVSPTGVYDQTLSNVGTPGSGSPSTTNVGTDEVTGTGYTSGGFALTNVSPSLSSNVATTSFSVNPTWTGATFSATSAVVFTNDATLGAAGRTVGSYDFGGTQTVTSGTFTVVLPANTNTLALIRIA